MLSYVCRNSSADFEWFLSMDEKEEEVCKHDLLIYFKNLFGFLQFLLINNFYGNSFGRKNVDNK